MNEVGRLQVLRAVPAVELDEETRAAFRGLLVSLPWYGPHPDWRKLEHRIVDLSKADSQEVESFFALGVQTSQPVLLLHYDLELPLLVDLDSALDHLDLIFALAHGPPFGAVVDGKRGARCGEYLAVFEYDRADKIRLHKLQKSE
jgi:hypothetical protein